jgi:hypothetical protein
MPRLEVSGAVRHIYIIRRLKVKIYSLRCFLVGLFCMTPFKVTRIGNVPSIHRQVILTSRVISETT